MIYFNLVTAVRSWCTVSYITVQCEPMYILLYRAHCFRQSLKLNERKPTPSIHASLRILIDAFNDAIEPLLVSLAYFPRLVVVKVMRYKHAWYRSVIVQDFLRTILFSRKFYSYFLLKTAWKIIRYDISYKRFVVRTLVPSNFFALHNTLLSIVFLITIS